MTPLAVSILALVDSLSLKPQSRMPTERELSETIGASRWHVRSALDELEKGGQIWRHVGKGTFLGARPIADVASIDLLARECSPSDVLDARQAVEPPMAAMAALHATASQVAELRSAAEACLASRLHDDEGYEAADERFHATIAEMARNVVLLSLFQTINSLRKRVVWNSMRKSPLWQVRRQAAGAEHAAILEAIIDRDPGRAEMAMREHLMGMTELYHNLLRSRAAGTIATRSHKKE